MRVLIYNFAKILLKTARKEKKCYREGGLHPWYPLDLPVMDLDCLLTTLTLIIVQSTHMIKQVEHRLACCPTKRIMDGMDFLPKSLDRYPSMLFALQKEKKWARTTRLVYLALICMF